MDKTNNKIVTVTTHYYDGKKSLPLDIKLYQHSYSLEEKASIGIELIDQTLNRGHHPGIVLIDTDYGNNTIFLKKLEERKLKYLGGIAKNRLRSIP
ncbi:MAG: transposase [Okeania sp. SIO2B3]|nr:transposase [Okeania sp. SIO2B3]